MGDELRFAACAAEMIVLACVGRVVFGRSRVHLHAADWICRAFCASLRITAAARAMLVRLVISPCHTDSPQRIIM